MSRRALSRQHTARWFTCALLVATLALAAPSRSSAAVLDYQCSPPSPATAANCDIWHTSPVTLHWVLAGLVPLSGCGDTVVAEDTPGSQFTCTAVGGLSNTATVKVDQTPPAVTGAAPSRPPDYNGWYNHPVAFAFAGTDATSGLAGCDSVIYAGPDTPAGSVTGLCHDVAGNSSTGSVPLKYDSTPPSLSLIPQDSSDGEVHLKWSASPDAVSYSVQREPGRDGPAPSTVYTGNSPEYEDTNVVNGTQYTYVITASDAAANAVSYAILALPGGRQTILGVRDNPAGSVPGLLGSAIVVPKKPLTPPRLRWPRAPKADYYNVQIYRGHRKVLSCWPLGTTYQMHSRWTFRGKSFRLTAGRYQWYVWPGYGSRRAHRYGKLLLHRRFTIK